MSYTILGFTENAQKIIFKKDDSWIFMKHTLPKNELIAFLDINPIEIDKHLRNQILETARLKGRKTIIYSLDDDKYQLRSYFSSNKQHKSWKYRQLIGIDEKNEYKEMLSNDEVDEIIANLKQE